MVSACETSKGVSIMDKCNLCHKEVDERNTQEQAGYSLCLTCSNQYSDEELISIMESA